MPDTGRRAPAITSLTPSDPPRETGIFLNKRGLLPPAAAESRTQSPTGVVFAHRGSGFMRGLWRDLGEGE
ncbi:unnamed protein product [Arctogadus glacialis]